MSAGERAPQAAIELVEWVRALPYGRPAERTVAGMLSERRGTCSTKHRYLAERLLADHPELQPTIVHRVWRVSRQDAQRLFGDSAAATVPAAGLTDVHRYVVIMLGGRPVTIDVTFPGTPPWDGCSSMPLACGPGVDHVSHGDPDRDKRALERLHCEAAREAFIAALADDRRGRPHRRRAADP